MTDVLLHALVIVSFLLVGVPSNVAVLWIHTRKNSRVAKNRFPLIFAAIDLFALIASLPLLQYAFETRFESVSYTIYLNASLAFTVNGYLMTLFMATIDKFYAVMFPFKYGKRRGTLFKTAIAIVTFPNAVLAIAIASSLGSIDSLAFILIVLCYNITFFAMFITINILYVFIIAKLIRNQRNLRKVNDNG